MNGWAQFRIQKHKLECGHVSNVLKMVIWEIADLLVMVFLNYGYTLVQVIEFILDRRGTQSFFYSAAGISPHKNEIQDERKLIGQTIKGDTYEKNENMA